MSTQRDTDEPDTATRRILLTDVPKWAGPQLSGPQALPPPRRVPVHRPGRRHRRTRRKSLAGLLAEAEAGGRPPGLPSWRDAPKPHSGELELSDADGATREAASRPPELSATDRWRWLWPWPWGQCEENRAPRGETRSVWSDDNKNSAERTPGGPPPERPSRQLSYRLSLPRSSHATVVIRTVGRRALSSPLQPGTLPGYDQQQVRGRPEDGHSADR